MICEMAVSILPFTGVPNGHEREERVTKTLYFFIFPISEQIKIVQFYNFVRFTSGINGRICLRPVDMD